MELTVTVRATFRSDIVCEVAASLIRMSPSARPSAAMIGDSRETCPPLADVPSTSNVEVDGATLVAEWLTGSEAAVDAVLNSFSGPVNCSCAILVVRDDGDAWGFVNRGHELTARESVLGMPITRACEDEDRPNVLALLQQEGE